MTLRSADPPSIAGEAVVDALAGLPYYLANLAVALLLLTIALSAYALLAGRTDLQRARQGHAGAAASCSGVLLGFALPIAGVVVSTGSLIDLLAWALVALGVQLFAVLVLHRVLRASASNESGEPDAGGFLHGVLSLAFGLLNAAAVAL